MTKTTGEASPEGRMGSVDLKTALCMPEHFVFDAVPERPNVLPTLRYTRRQRGHTYTRSRPCCVGGPPNSFRRALSANDCRSCWRERCILDSTVPSGMPMSSATS